VSGTIGGRVDPALGLGPVKVRAQRERPQPEEPDEWVPDLERNLRARAPGAPRSRRRAAGARQTRARLDPEQIGEPGLSRLDVFVAALQGLCLALPLFLILRAYLWKPIEALLAEVVLGDPSRVQLRLTLLGCLTTSCLLAAIVAASRTPPRRRITKLTRWGTFVGGVWLSFWSLATLVGVLG